MCSPFMFHRNNTAPRQLQYLTRSAYNESSNPKDSRQAFVAYICNK
jgi:hypothetical protein